MMNPHGMYIKDFILPKITHEIEYKCLRMRTNLKSANEKCDLEFKDCGNCMFNSCYSYALVYEYERLFNDNKFLHERNQSLIQKNKNLQNKIKVLLCARRNNR